MERKEGGRDGEEGTEMKGRRGKGGGRDGEEGTERKGRRGKDG